MNTDNRPAAAGPNLIVSPQVDDQSTFFKDGANKSLNAGAHEYKLMDASRATKVMGANVRSPWDSSRGEQVARSSEAKYSSLFSDKLQILRDKKQDGVSTRKVIVGFRI